MVSDAPLMEIWFVFWMVAPSAWGSVYEMPSSISDDPPCSMATRMVRVSMVIEIMKDVKVGIEFE